MANDLGEDVSRCAEQAVDMSRDRGGPLLDYSEASMETVEAIVAEIAGYADHLTEKQSRMLVEMIGCYILEVARRNHGGVYYWFEERDQPVLVCGEPEFHIALLAWD